MAATRAQRHRRYNPGMVTSGRTAQCSSAYVAAGVDIDAANTAVERMKSHIALTRLPGVLSSSAGSFGGMFSLADAARSMQEPVLVSSIDGIGTKLKLAFITGRHAVVAEDLVYHCVDDILVQGARPLFFLDYFGTGRLSPEVAEQVVAGLSRACRATGCVLIGGETAEMPGMYGDGEYDLAGAIVGIVDRSRIVDGSGIKAGDSVIGLLSNGLHTNGYSLARHVLFETAKVTLTATIPNSDRTYQEALLASHRCYAPAILPILDDEPRLIRGLAHITGGGLLENLPRIVPNGLRARIETSTWTPLPIFDAIRTLGQIEHDEMFRVFNMGIGYVAVCDPADEDHLMSRLRAAGENVVHIGTIEQGSGVILI